MGRDKYGRGLVLLLKGRKRRERNQISLLLRNPKPTEGRGWAFSLVTCTETFFKTSSHSTIFINKINKNTLARFRDLVSEGEEILMRSSCSTYVKQLIHIRNVDAVLLFPIKPPFLSSFPFQIPMKLQHHVRGSIFFEN